MATGGRVVIFVVGFEAQYWRRHKFGLPAHTVDVRKWMPRDPAAVQHFKRMALLDYVLSQDGFVEATAAVVRSCLVHSRCICGSSQTLKFQMTLKIANLRAMSVLGNNISIPESLLVNPSLTQASSGGGDIGFRRGA